MSALPFPRAFGAAPTIAQIQRAVAAEFGTSRAELISDRRDRCVVVPRQLAYALAKELTPASLTQIGRAFGKRDHTTIHHGLAATRKRLADDEVLAARAARLRRALAPPPAEPLPELQLDFLPGPLFEAAGLGL